MYMDSTKLDLDQLNTILEPPNLDEEFDCSPMTKSRGFTLLMKLVLLTRKHPELLEYIKILINNNKDIINQKNEKGWTSLILVARNSRTYSTENTLRLLIDDARTDVNLQDNKGWTALMTAAKNSNTDSTENTIKMLLDDARTDVNLQDNGGLTALMIAVRYSSRDSIENIIKMFIDDARMDVDLQDNEGSTALMNASRRSHTNIVKMLIDVGANVNLQDNEGETALMIAIRYSRIDSIENIVKMFIDAGTNVNLMNNNNWTALRFAFCNINSDNISEDIIEMLINAETNLNSINYALLKRNVNKESKIYKLIIKSNYDYFFEKLLQNSEIYYYLFNILNNSISDEAKLDLLKQFELAIREHEYIKSKIGLYFKKIPDASHHIKLKDGNLGSKILKIHFDIKNGINLDDIYKNLKSERIIIDYLGINDKDDFLLKIESYINYLEI
jgi:ankyrin repeat protein